MELEYARLGRSDLEVTQIGLGTWQYGTEAWGWKTDFHEQDALAAIAKALELGINLIDTAELYGDGKSEKLVGKAIRAHREELVVATKVSGGHLREKDLRRACEGSLKRLGIERIDLYQIHWPSSYAPVEETMAGLEKLIEQGKIRYIGVSNFPASLVREAQTYLNNGIIANQVRYNLLQRDIERGILPYCREEGITIIAYSPLAQALLTGKYDQVNLPKDAVRQRNPLFKDRDNMRRALEAVRQIEEMARAWGRTATQLALRWLIQQRGVVAIPGAKRPKQVEENVAAMGWQLTDQEWQKLDRLTAELELSYF